MAQCGLSARQPATLRSAIWLRDDHAAACAWVVIGITANHYVLDAIAGVATMVLHQAPSPLAARAPGQQDGVGQVIVAAARLGHLAAVVATAGAAPRSR